MPRTTGWSLTLGDQLRHRIELARAAGSESVRWRVSPASIDAIKRVTADLWEGSERLLGLPVDIAAMRRDWGVELICEPSTP